MSIQKLINRFNKSSVLTPESYIKMLDNRAPVILLDVRTQEEYNDAHILNAILFPVSYIESNIEQYYPDKNLIYIIYCRSGIRSHTALVIMRRLGYKNVFDMGGIIDWPYELI